MLKFSLLFEVQSLILTQPAASTCPLAVKKYKLADFEFSQSYPFFYDQLNKANVFLEQMLEMAEDDLDSRLVSDLVSYPVGGKSRSFVPKKVG